tara:strand:+ start:678 stop:836 length:159 start_codon:yes stop_codon:yes gene_type:complete
MNGAIALPCDKTIKPPKINKKINIGINQYFFLSSKNFKNSIIYYHALQTRLN